jgi:hypothetical protein
MSGNNHQNQGDKTKDKTEQQFADEDFRQQLTSVVVAGKAAASRRQQNKEKKEKEKEDEKKKEMFKQALDAADVSKDRRMKEEIGFF